jgi:hypothetical protein
MAPAKFRFYEVVRVISQKALGQEGAVLGMADDEHGWGYAVSLYSTGICTDFSEEELEATGRMDRRETFYDDDEPHIRVAVDPATGKGRIVEE